MTSKERYPWEIFLIKFIKAKFMSGFSTGIFLITHVINTGHLLESNLHPIIKSLVNMLNIENNYWWKSFSFLWMNSFYLGLHYLSSIILQYAYLWCNHHSSIEIWYLETTSKLLWLRPSTNSCFFSGYGKRRFVRRLESSNFSVHFLFSFISTRHSWYGPKPAFFW